MSLRNRMFLATALVAAISVLSALPLVSVRAEREAEADLQRGLENAAHLVETRHAARLESSALVARLVADLPKLKAALATADPPTIAPLAREYRDQVHAQMLAVTDAKGALLASVGAPPSPRDAAAAVAAALQGREAVGFSAQPRGVLEIVTVPVLVGPELLGTLSLGFLLDDALAADLKAATESEVVVGVGRQVVASTLPREHDAALAARLRPGSAGPVTLSGNEHALLARALGPAGAEGPVALILRSRTERLRLLRTFRQGLIAAGLIGLLCAVVLSYAVAGTVTRPLSAIADAMREISATGDLARKVRLDPGAGDADTRLLATTLDSLTDALARFQQEAAMRERLSALGRMATVVAHEVRNPLLVVKASLRTLRRPDLPAEERQEALMDIEAEVARLNRIVNDVLDFTRPVRVDLEPADLAAVVREATDALQHQEPPVRVRVRDAGPAPLVTDAERVRAVLANVLTNAREAVLARAAGADVPAPGEWDIELRVEGAGGDRLAVEVEDRGVGLTDAHLARAFDPYFTTKRAGSGLGLAIAKNVMESLGGTIALRSRLGEGTVVRMELPVRPRPGQKDAA